MPRIPFIFPEKGLDEGVNYASQMPDTSSDCDNVRVYDPIKNRRRGGSRGGLSKWTLAQVNGSARVQNMKKAIEATGAVTNVATDILVSHAINTNASPDSRATHYTEAGSGTALANESDSVPDSITAATKSLAGNFYFSGDYDGSDTAWKTNSSGAFQWGTVTGGGGSSCVYSEFSSELIVAALSDLHGMQDSDGVSQWNVACGSTILYVAVGPDGNIFVGFARNSNWAGATGNATLLKISPTGTVLESFDSGSFGESGNGTLSISIGSDYEIVVSGSLATANHTDATGSADVFLLDNNLNLVNAILAFSTDQVDRYVGFFVNGDIGVGIKGATNRSQVMALKRIKQDGTVVYTNTAINGTGNQALHGFGIDRDDQIIFAGAIGTEWLGGAGSVNLLVLDGLTGGIRQWAANTVGAILDLRIFDGTPPSAATRKARVATVAGGDIFIIDAGAITKFTSGDDVLVTGPFDVQCVNAYSKLFYVDGTNVVTVNLVTDTASTWTATTAGTLPALPRLIARYRGRVVLSGLVADPNNWFMSRSGDPFDWEYSPATTDALQAVAGNIGEVGLLGDIVTALIPYDDDMMVIGMDSSIALMAGDPAAGGAIDVISNDTGMAWDAWCLDPNDTLYFMGLDGVYRMPRGGVMENITRGRLDEAFADVDQSKNRFLMQWDYLRHGVQVIIANVSSTVVNQAFFYEARTDGWFPEAYPVGIGPDCMLAYDSEVFGDKALLFGSRDGYIRKIDDEATNDDGTTISSNIRMFPIGTRRGTDNRLYGLEITLADDSGDVTLKLYSGQTAEQVATSTTVRWSRTLKEGRNVLTLPRLSGAWLQIEFAATTRWGLESVFGLFEEKGRSRRLKR